MRVLTFFVVACVGLALMQAAAKLAAWLALIAGLATFATRPRESIGCVATIMLLGLVDRFPLAGLAILGVLLLLAWLERSSDHP